MGGTESRYVATTAYKPSVVVRQPYNPPAPRTMVAPRAIQPQIQQPVQVQLPQQQLQLQPQVQLPQQQAPRIVRADLDREKIYYGKVTPAQMAALVELAKTQQQSFIGGYFVGGKDVDSKDVCSGSNCNLSSVIMILLFIVVIIAAVITASCMWVHPEKSPQPTK